ncbi:hypothetical protein L6V77_01870 [Myxococcota bacterium]|nr:hypothetical protein [Myxococcota bacterium]
MRFEKRSLAAVLATLAVFGCEGEPPDETSAGGSTGGAIVEPDMGGEGGSEGGTVVRPDADLPDARLPACSDALDNDGDGKTDTDDPGCEGPSDIDEVDPPAPVACADGADNDQDGYTDFPADPGCGSAQDTTEENPPQPPQCNNGIDDDHDNLVDEQDPGCTSPADPSEEDPEEDPVCLDGVDNDGDGITDFPFDPGCRSAGDADELNPPNPPACANNEDDDGDALVDYPDDPGCTGAGDTDEEDKAVRPACADGLDNDRDGRIDYPDDDGCQAAADYDERGSCGDRYDPPVVMAGVPVMTDISRGVFRTHGSCGGQGNPELAFLYRVDRRLEALEITTVGDGTTVPTTLYVRRQACLDEAAEVGCSREAAGLTPPGNTLRIPSPDRGDYFIFVDGVAGAAGPVQFTVNEVELAECLNGVDDDGNGRVDYPSDPGCDEPTDRDETAPAEPPACANDEDDDGDGAVDYPLDFGCISAAGTSEVDRCGQGVRFQEFPSDREFVLGDTSQGTNDLAGTCGGRNQKEVIFHYSNPYNARLTFSTNHEETTIPTVLYIRRECTGPELDAPAGCDDGAIGANQHGRLTIDRAAVGDYWVVVDTRLGAGGPFKLSVDVRRLDPGCSDGRDNDGDGAVDGDDPGCEGPLDEDEADPPRGTPPSICANGVDDDGDGETDFPYDPGCSARGDPNEDDPEVVPQCANGVDDDDDGRIDFPLEPGCQSRGDDNERNPVPAPLCGNAIDDDGDARRDYPQDPGCYAAGDATEQDPAVRPVCSNTLDDDRDGIADFPFDPGCEAAGDPDESDPPEGQMPVCSNGIDDDDDGLADFPRDFGCTYAADPSEQGAAFPPQCANGNDDDRDGRTDFPDDPGCRFAADEDETNVGVLPPRCNDGVDNDFDGAIDFSDLGCLDAEDDNESDDPEPAPLCGDEIDNDGDGTTDWPDDVGCQAAGDLTEDQSCRPEVDTPLIPRNGSVRGATVLDGPDVYTSRCGGRQAPDAVYKYVLEAEANVTFSLDNPGTDFPAIITLRNDCEEPTSALTCAGNFANPVPTIMLNGAAPGEYYIFVDGGGPERWISSGNALAFPASPDGFSANHDMNANGWSDGGNDAFDGFGQIVLESGGQRGNVDVTIGERQAQVGAYGYTVNSDWASQNVWRVRLDPTVEFDERPVTLTVTGNMGCDRDCLDPGMIEFEGRTLNYYTSTDQFDPDTVQMLIPSDPEEQGNVTFSNAADNVTIVARDIKLPATLYVGLTNGNLVQAAEALLTDLELQAGPGGPEAARFGNFELTVQEN